MNGTSAETSTHSMDEVPSPTAEEVAVAYEQASDGGGVTPEPSSGPAAPDTASSEPSPPSNSSVPTEVLSDIAAPSASSNNAVPLSDTAVPSNDPPPSSAGRGVPPSSVVPPPGALPVPRMNLQDNLRLRMKVWTDPDTLKRYLMPMAFMRDVMHGQPITDVMYAYAMSDDSTRIVTLTAGEWNTLPFFYFQEDGHAPRAAARSLDVLP